MKEIKGIFFMLATLLLFAACQVNYIDDTLLFREDAFDDLPGCIVLDSDETSYRLVFTSGGKWKAELDSRAETWCSLENADGIAGENTLVILLEKNEDYIERNVALTIYCGSNKSTLTIVQKQKDALLLDSSKLEVSERGGDYEIRFRTNCVVKADIIGDCDWIHLDTVSTKALSSESIHLHIDSNFELERREAMIRLASGNIYETVSILQAKGREIVVLSKLNYTVPSAGETICVELKTNTDYDYEVQDDWIKEVRTKAISSYTHYFRIETNESYDSRTGQVIFTNKKTAEKDTVTVLQLQKDAILPLQDKYILDHKEQTLSILLETNNELNVSIDSDWISFNGIIKTKGLEDVTASFSVQANYNVDEREATITFEGGGITRAVLVRQKKPGTIDVTLEHCEEILPILFVGYYTRVFGTIDWGDGAFYKGYYDLNTNHKYDDSSSKVTRFVFIDDGGFTINNLNSISKITIIVD